MNYVELTVYTSEKHYTAIVGVSNQYHYINEYGNAAYLEWCRAHDRVPGKDSSYDYRYLGGKVEFLNVEV